ncbi:MULTISPECIES: WYL domain-containing protein [Stenotrophomonas]|uniref:helix-turn-helix transcriptional regulator n=1 Tax=Stenotrophomonas TaxID=40323 RepID=UPI00066C697C|nr:MULTISPECIES: WYL domain-containing protein [Stenotrophomonas]MDH2178604.1 WYL domain-containing protein [Stenotrophomonas sp. GD03654]HDS1082807.1 WYL domain-containing protein [Stenotrophomonas maltophilia]
MTEAQKETAAAGRVGAKWGQERRLEFIDYRLSWSRVLNRGDLTAFFGISIPQASLDLAEYQRRAPGNLEYDTSRRTYRASATFESAFPSSSHARYLEDLLRAAVDSEVPYGSFLGWYPPVAVVPRPWRRLDASVVISVVGAIRNGSALRVRYQSLSSLEPADRTLSPHALVSDGYRWHMRAYCHDRGAFRDFLLSRVLEILGEEADRGRAATDHAWHEEVELVLVPHPLLSLGHRAVIELDYGMENGRCILRCRQALLFYVLQQLGLDEDACDRAPERQQIVLENRCDIEHLLPRRSSR